jgi:hypothetical protein
VIATSGVTNTTGTVNTIGMIGMAIKLPATVPVIASGAGATAQEATRTGPREATQAATEVGAEAGAANTPADTHVVTEQEIAIEIMTPTDTAAAADLDPAPHSATTALTTLVEIGMRIVATVVEETQTSEAETKPLAPAMPLRLR